MGNPVTYFEIGGPDDRPLAGFYSELFRWNVQPVPGGGYNMIDTRAGSGINGGIGRSQAGAPWCAFYVEADDPQAVLDQAESLGAKTVVPVTTVNEQVTFAMFGDPGGLLVGLLASADPAARPEWYGPSAGDGPPVDWFEVLGSDAGRTQRFYSDLFGWTAGDSGSPGYRLAQTGAGRGIGGGLGSAGQSRWATVYGASPAPSRRWPRPNRSAARGSTDRRQWTITCRPVPSATRRATCSGSITTASTDRPRLRAA